ncbi:hypothetical protein GCM10023259_077940 [Thermocatellispora tengchongensis]
MLLDGRVGVALVPLEHAGIDAHPIAAGALDGQVEKPLPRPAATALRVRRYDQAAAAAMRSITVQPRAASPSRPATW